LGLIGDDRLAQGAAGGGQEQEQGKENIEHRTSNAERRTADWFCLIRFHGSVFPVEGLKMAGREHSAGQPQPKDELGSQETRKRNLLEFMSS
jgi:hypothetical protein